MAEELWREVLGGTDSVHREAWPVFDPAAVVADEIEMVVQVNGKVRAKINVATEAPKDSIEAAALEAVRSWLEGVEVKKVVVVPGKLVSVVAK